MSFITNFFLKYKAAIFPLLLLLILSISACATKREPSVAFSLDGPPLYIRGTIGRTDLLGRMDRNLMVGLGKIKIESSDAKMGLQCEANLDSPPTDKGRIRGLLNCNNEDTIYFTLRNLGPDQGVGLGQSKNHGSKMLLFYHSADEEAKRRLPQVVKDIENAQNAQKASQEDSVE